MLLAEAKTNWIRDAVEVLISLKNGRIRFPAKILTILTVVFCCLTVGAQEPETAKILFHEGLHLEEVKGELEQAIAVYQRVIEEFPSERPVAARAQLHTGICYEKLGQEKAREAYSRVIQEFGEQPEVVVEARSRLTRLTLPLISPISEKKAIAVMPFENLTGEADFDIWENGIPELLITALSGSRELYVLDSQTLFDVLESINQERAVQIASFLASQVRSTVGVELLVLGNILKAGDKLQVQVKIQNAESGNVLRSEIVEGVTEDDFFDMAKTLSQRVKDYLEIETLKEDVEYDLRDAFTASAEAYRNYVQGMKSFFTSDYESARQSYTKAVEIDTNFTLGHFWLFLSLNNMGKIGEARQWFERAYKRKDSIPYKFQLMIEAFKASRENNIEEEIKLKKKILELDPQMRIWWFKLGFAYVITEQWEEAIEPLEHAIELTDRWGSAWKWSPIYSVLGRAHRRLGQYDKAIEVYEKGLSVLPDNHRLLGGLAVAHEAKGDSSRANMYLTRYEANRKKQGWSQSRIELSLGRFWYGANDLDKAQELFRDAVTLDTLNSSALHWLAWLLIDHDINVDEGMDFIQRALEIKPDDPNCLDTQGWGYYKQGKYKEAVEVLESAWERDSVYFKDSSGYDHEFLQRLELAKAALSKDE